MRIALPFCLAIQLLSVSSLAQAVAGDDFSVIVERYRQILLLESPEHRASRAGRERPDVGRWLASLGPDGAWPDIDYADKRRSSWKTSLHLNRTRLMARALADSNHPLHGNHELEAVTLRALDYWLAKRFRNPNWWHNQIGVPMAARDIIVLLGDKLAGKRRAAALELLGQAGRTKNGGAANTLWIAELGLQRGALTRDARLVGESSRVISDEIKITTGEGIQADYSFHQHASRLQQFAYGRAFFINAVRVAWQLRGTKWEIPQRRIEDLADFALRGCQWMCRGIYTVPSTLDRSASRRDAFAWADLRGSLRLLREFLPDRARALDEFVARQDGWHEPLVGARVFPRSDFTVHHRPTFSCFVKTLSDRTLPTEVGLNGEHLKGALQGCGDHYLLKDGLEYFNLAPVWNWNLLPGVTYGNGAGQPQRQSFVGAVSDGQSSVSAMDYCFGTKDRISLRARKLWACHGDVVVALIGNLDAPAMHQPVRTALDQCVLRDAVTIADEDGIQQMRAAQRENVSVRWVHHSGFAYAPLGGLKISIRAAKAVGSWKSINDGLSPDTVTAPVFLALLEHGMLPTAQSSGFVIASCNAPQAEEIFQTPSWLVLRNDFQAQAVKFADGALMVAFYQPGEVVAEGRPVVQADKPCILMQRQGRLAVVDPTQQGGKLNLYAGGKLSTLDLPGGGTVVTVP